LTAQDSQEPTLKASLLSLAITASLLMPAPALHAQTNELPTLGDASSSLVSLPEEYQLGRNWLRQLRAHATTLDNPLMLELLERLIYRLTPHADTPQTQLAFVIVDQPELNAFAVPGGIVGVNFGLLLHTQDEDEFSSVLAHELAHLSQRHFARRAEVGQNEAPVVLAALLASILIAATVDAEAGMAGIMATQGASIQNQLAYSRAWEREADRIGFTTMVKSGLDPQAMPDMFHNMLDAAKYYRKPPEFLLTHPLTSRRIADAASRAENHPAKPRRQSFLFSILRNEAVRHYRLEKKQASLFFSERLSRAKQPLQEATLNYTLATIELDQNNTQQARKYLTAIPDEWQAESPVLILKARILSAENDSAGAVAFLKRYQPWFPDSYAYNMAYANALQDNGKPAAALEVLKRLNTQRPENPTIWAHIAELARQENRMQLAHQAAAEAAFLTGADSRAARHMDLAILEATKSGNFQKREALQARLKKMAIADMEENRPGKRLTR